MLPPESVSSVPHSVPGMLPMPESQWQPAHAGMHLSHPDQYLLLLTRYHFHLRRIYRLPPSISAHIKEEIQEMEKNFALNDEYTLQAYNAHLVNMLILLSRFGNSTASHEPELSHMSYIMQEAASYIDRNFHRNLTLSELAEKYSYSKEYFSGEFKKSTGRGFAEYLNHVRIVHALELLGDKSLHISDISAKCGFNDSNYFSSVFKKALGISPLQYRQKQY